jgi:hypothetical protein
MARATPELVIPPFLPITIPAPYAFDPDALEPPIVNTKRIVALLTGLGLSLAG